MNKLSAEVEKSFVDVKIEATYYVAEDGYTVAWDKIDQFLADTLAQQKENMVEAIDNEVRMMQYAKPDFSQKDKGIIQGLQHAKQIIKRIK